MPVGARDDFPAVVVDHAMMPSAQEDQVTGKSPIHPQVAAPVAEPHAAQHLRRVRGSHRCGSSCTGDVPCSRRTRVPAATVVGMIAEGIMAARIVAENRRRVSAAHSRRCPRSA